MHGGTKGVFISSLAPSVHITIMMVTTMREKSVTAGRKFKSSFPYGQTVSFVIASSLHR